MSCINMVPKCTSTAFKATTTIKSFIPITLGRLHEVKENPTGTITWMILLYPFLFNIMSSFKPLASISFYQLHQYFLRLSLYSFNLFYDDNLHLVELVHL